MFSWVSVAPPWGPWRSYIGYQSTLIGISGCLRICLVYIWVLTKQKKYWQSFRGNLKRYHFLKSAYFQEWGQDLGAIRHCISHQSILFGVCGCLTMCFVNIWVLTKQRNYWRSYKGHLKKYPFLKGAYFQEWGSRFSGFVTPLHRLSINFDWYEWMP